MEEESRTRGGGSPIRARAPNRAGFGWRWRHLRSPQAPSDRACALARARIPNDEEREGQDQARPPASARSPGVASRQDATVVDAVAIACTKITAPTFEPDEREAERDPASPIEPARDHAPDRDVPDARRCRRASNIGRQIEDPGHSSASSPTATKASDADRRRRTLVTTTGRTPKRDAGRADEGLTDRRDEEHRQPSPDDHIVRVQPRSAIRSGASARVAWKRPAPI